MEYRDYYKILGMARTATADEIKKAYRRLARKFHPDVSKEANAEQKFKEVQEAYEVLKDPEKRAAYDQLGSEWKSGEQFRPPPDWGGGFEFRGGPRQGRAGARGGARHAEEFEEAGVRVHGLKAVQQKQCRSISPTSLAIRNLQTINIGTTVVDRAH